ncbi:MAG: cellulose binding domain-containing protein, partial [Clostridium sp.]
MKRKQLGLLIAAVLLVAPILTGANTEAAQAKETSGVSCVFNSNSKQESTNTLGGNIKIKNTSGKDVDLSKLTIDYYYSAGSETAQNFWCDYCGVTKGEYQNLTSSVKATFEKTGSTDKTKSDVIKITFASGVLKAGDEADLQFRVAKNDWSNYDQSDDYAYHNGVVVDGETGSSTDDPIEEKVTPGVTPESVVYDQNKPASISTTIDYKGHEKDAALKSIKNG